MKKFITIIIIFTLPIILFSALIDYSITTGLRKTEKREYKDWNKLLNGEINSDLLIQGSSRAWVHVSPKIIDSVLNTNS